MTYEEHLDEVATLLTEIYTLSDEIAIDIALQPHLSLNERIRGVTVKNIAFPALVEHHFTAGVGFSPMQDLWINLGGVYAPKVTIDGANMNQAITDYSSSCQEYSIDLGVSYRF